MLDTLVIIAQAAVAPTRTLVNPALLARPPPMRTFAAPPLPAQPLRLGSLQPRATQPVLAAPPTDEPPSVIAAKPGKQQAFLNARLVQSIVLNQLIIAVIVLIWGPALRVIHEEIHLDNPNLGILGFAAAVPLILVQYFSARSDSDVVTDPNISTTLFTLALFGPKSRPLFVLVTAGALSLLTGVTEEVAFRGCLLPYISHTVLDHVALQDANIALNAGVIGSALAFAMGHLPLSSARGLSDVFTLETGFIALLEFGFGLYFAALYVLTGELTVPILAHALYDTSVFFDTHMALTSQLEYARTSMPPSKMALQMDRGGKPERWKARLGSDFVEKVRQTFLLMDSDRDGFLSQRELRTGLRSFGVKEPDEGLSFEFELADKDRSGAINFSEFLDFVGDSATPAPRVVKRALLGAGTGT